MTLRTGDFVFTKLLNEDTPKVWAVIFETGEEAISGLQRFAAEQRLSASTLQAIGAFRDVTLGYFDWERKDYVHIEVREQVEVLSLIGDIVLNEEKQQVHAHVVLGKRDGSAHGGNLIEGHVRPTLEVILTEMPGYLQKQHDAESGLALIRR
jgi:predicted DNA-binding protein with PD1-like motif